MTRVWRNVGENERRSKYGYLWCISVRLSVLRSDLRFVSSVRLSVVRYSVRLVAPFSGVVRFGSSVDSLVTLRFFYVRLGVVGRGVGDWCAVG